MDALRILADAMNYLDHTYCRGSILEWIDSSPEGAAYLILRQLFTQVLEEPIKSEGALRLPRFRRRSVAEARPRARKRAGGQ